MRRQAFAIVDGPEGEVGFDEIPNGSIVEIQLDLCGGLDGLIMLLPTEEVPVIFDGKSDTVFKDWLKDFWVV